LAVALIAALLLTCLASSARAADRVYWVNDASSNKISFANLDGSGAGNLSTAGASTGATRGLAIDVAGGRIYWTNRSANRISFANLDGSGGGGDLNTIGATVSNPNAAAVYPAAGRIYWGNETGNLISFANLDNSGGGNLITTSLPIGPAVYPESGRIYWGNANPSNTISFANLDGSGVQSLNTGGASVTNPHGVAVDPVAGRVYWANVGTGTTYTGNGIAWANLDGSGGGDFHPVGATVDVPVGVAIDPAARKLYWANFRGNRISYANLDGSGGGDLPTPGVTPAGARSAVLLKAPVGAGAPAVTGGSRARAVLSCSPGSWAPDLLGSWLYRTPQRLAYSWTRDGAGIQGASAATYTASQEGDYRCTVTASNPAGGSAQTSSPHSVSPAAGGASSRAFGKKTRVTLRIANRRIRGRGPIKVVVSNDNPFKIAVKLSARARSGRSAIKRKTFSVGARARKSVAVRLSKALARNKKLSLRLIVRVEDPAGHTRIVTKKVSLKLRRG
jgi:low density lipoprotein receptor-related protein 5/6